MSSDSRPQPLSLRCIICNFTPAWFSVVMGTGIISTLFHSFPYGGDSSGMKRISMVIFFFNLCLFVFFSAVTVTRFVLFPKMWARMMRHPVQSLYLSCFPMAASTLINSAVNLLHVTYGFGGQSFVYAIWGIWWVDVVVSALCCWGLVHVMITMHTHSLDQMTAAWLFPVVALIVSSSSGGVLSPAIQPYSVSHALLTTATSGIILTIGYTLSFMMLVMYLLRLILHGLPPGATILSLSLPHGPTGQAGYSVLLMGQAYQALLPLRYGDSAVLTAPATGATLNIICIFCAFTLWAFSTMWILFAVLGFYDVCRQTRFPFRLPFWGLIFPNGVYANLTISLSKTLDSPFFKVYGAVYAIITFMLWVGVAVRTMMLLRGGTIFEAPCMEDIDLTRFVPPVESKEVRSTNTSVTRK